MASLSDKSKQTKVLFFPFLLALALSRVQRSQRRGFAVLSLTHTHSHTHTNTQHRRLEVQDDGGKLKQKVPSECIRCGVFFFSMVCGEYLKLPGPPSSIQEPKGLAKELKLTKNVIEIC